MKINSFSKMIVLRRNALWQFIKVLVIIAALSGSAQTQVLSDIQSVSSQLSDRRKHRESRRENLDKFLALTNGNEIAARRMLEREERKNRALPKTGILSNESVLADSSFSPTSSVDPTFSPNLSTPGIANKIVSLPGDKFLVCGEFGKITGVTRRQIARLNADGSVDATFNFTATSIGGRDVEYIEGCLAQPDGKIIFVFNTYQSPSFFCQSRATQRGRNIRQCLCARNFRQFYYFRRTGFAGKREGSS